MNKDVAAVPASAGRADTSMKGSGSNAGQKEFSGRLPFRTSSTIHQRIAEAANQREKSINAWMEEILAEAANDILGFESQESESALNSPAIRRLLNDTDEATAEWVGQLIGKILPHLEKSDPMSIIRFNSALKKLLIGIDALRPLVGEISGKNFSGLLANFYPHQTVDGLLTSTLGILLVHNHSLDLRQLIGAIKRLGIGIRAIYPMVKRDQPLGHLLQIFEKIETELLTLESLG